MRRSKFSLSNYKLFSADMGELVPCGLLEVLPGDTVQQATSALVRCAPLLAPIMHPIEVRIHHWYVPHRLVWPGFEDFITGGPTGTDATAFPTINISTALSGVGSLADYLGIPPVAGSALTVSALPFRGYSLIWNEFYRDQDLEAELVVNTGNGVDGTTNKTLQNISWERDYFTAARPWEQKGPAITIPLGTRANISGIAVDNATAYTNAPGAMSQATGVAPAGTNWSGVGPSMRIRGDNTTKVPDIYADLTGASAVTVNVLREALALQRYEENRARFGSRYVEYLRYLGVKSSDGRMQRPEYLGGGNQVIQFSEVLATAEAGTAKVGDMKGHGIAAMRSNRYRRFFEEHGYVFSLMSVRPKAMYGSGLARHWNRRTKEDFWQKELEGIGQQEVLNKEVYINHTTRDGVFGFSDRYAEYRNNPSSIGGEFRTTLNFWHESRIFASDPALNATFTKCVPSGRIFAVPASDDLYVMAKHSIQARRLVAPTGKSFIY
ncbi:major capsid protein [Apis mellifera associated microvirus 38]|nr:major capsid protein [Apis mellifera associated microvirus 38]